MIEKLNKLKSTFSEELNTISNNIKLEELEKEFL